VSVTDLPRSPWYQRRVRVLALCALAAASAACGSAPAPAPTSAQAAASITAVNPARIDRSRSVLPDGYEVTSYAGEPTVTALWGMRDPTQIEPPQCAPPPPDATARGWTASGPGGIVYAVVAPQPAGPGAPLPADCAHWTASSGPTTASVTQLAGPPIDAAGTVGMRTDAVTVVEGGTETRSHADTFVAALDGYVCLVALVTDPGSPHPPLPPGFASELLVQSVSALRG
jgi:hypothetical protein